MSHEDTSQGAERNPWDPPEPEGFSEGGKILLGGLAAAALLLVPLVLAAGHAMGIRPGEVGTAAVGTVKNLGVVGSALWNGGVPTDYQTLIRKTQRGDLSAEERRRVEAYARSLGLSDTVIEDARRGRLKRSDKRILDQLAADMGLLSRSSVSR